MEAVVSYQLLKHQISLSPSCVLFPLTLIIYWSPPSVSLYLSLITGEDKGLCGPFIPSHSERWLRCIVGNRIQLCCGRCVCVCVCWCEHVQECVCVRASLQVFGTRWSVSYRFDSDVSLSSRGLICTQTNSWGYTVCHEVLTAEYCVTFNYRFLEEQRELVLQLWITLMWCHAGRKRMQEEMKWRMIYG